MKWIGHLRLPRLPKRPLYLALFTSRKVEPVEPPPLDTLIAWRAHYRQLAVTGVRSPAVAAKMGFNPARPEMLQRTHVRFGLI